MAVVNQVVLEGNVVRDAETIMCKNGRPLCKVPIAVSRYYKNKAGTFDKEVSYFDIVTFGEDATRCGTECKKGRGVHVSGRLKQDRYVDKEGKTRSSVCVYADYVGLKPCTNARDSQSAPHSQAPASYAPAPAAAYPQAPAAQGGASYSATPDAVKENLASASSALYNEQQAGSEGYPF